MAAIAVWAVPATESAAATNDDLVARGRDIFFNETFGGNGRTCGTCHRAEDNFGLSPAFISRLPDDDPLFVAETLPALKDNFENPKLMRRSGLILENVDGFDDLENEFAMRGVPHVLSMETSIDSSEGPRLGWSGDGSPDDGSLRSFSKGAVKQHFTKTTAREPGIDFREPTDEELDALEAFQRSLGRKEDIRLPLPLKDPDALRGQSLFLDNTRGKCNQCHQNAGANANAGGMSGNLNFNTGVEDLPTHPADDTGETIPPDDGFGTPGDGTFNTPPLVEAADTAPFFHDNSVETLEGAVDFYNTDAFNQSPSGLFLASIDVNGIGIQLDETEVLDIAAFLRVINVLENIRVSIELLEDGTEFALMRAIHETEDSIMVLLEGLLHPEAISHLELALALTEAALEYQRNRDGYISEAIHEQKLARGFLIFEAPIPEPTTLALFGFGLAGLGIMRRRKPI